MDDRVETIISSYLSSESSSAQSTADELTSIIEDLPDPTSFDSAGILFQTILRHVRATTHDNANVHARLVSLITSIQNRSSSKRDWSSLEPLGITIREAWNGPGRVDDTWYPVDEWTSLNAFVARLTASRSSTNTVLDFDVYGIWAMRSALEDWTGIPGEDGPLSAETLREKVPAAAVWVIYATEHMFRLSKEGKDDGRIATGGPRWKGKSGYSVERWNFWAKRFEEVVSETSGMDEATKEIGKRAKASMLNLNTRQNALGVDNLSSVISRGSGSVVVLSHKHVMS